MNINNDIIDIIKLVLVNDTIKEALLTNIEKIKK